MTQHRKPPETLAKVYELVGAGEVDDALDVIYGDFDRMMRMGEWNACAWTLANVDHDKLDVVTTVGFLSISWAGRDMLPGRSLFVAQVRAALLDKGRSEADVDELLDGIGEVMQWPHQRADWWGYPGPRRIMTLAETIRECGALSTPPPPCDTPSVPLETTTSMTTHDINQTLIATIDAEIERLNDLKRTITGDNGGPTLTVKRGFAGVEAPTVTRVAPGNFEVEFPEGTKTAPVAKVAKKAAKKSAPAKGNEGLLTFLGGHPDGAKAEDLGKIVHKKGRNLTRHLVRLVDAKVIARKGQGRGMRYFAR